MDAVIASHVLGPGAAVRLFSGPRARRRTPRYDGATKALLHRRGMVGIQG
jgi:hypothetical protein